MIEKSGAKLVEVGTTNRTHLYDYENAINENTGLLLWVHTSNYIIKGFTSSPEISDIVSLGKKFNLPTMVDLGCGEIIDLSNQGLKTNFVVSKIVQKNLILSHSQAISFLEVLNQEYLLAIRSYQPNEKKFTSKSSSTR